MNGPDQTQPTHHTDPSPASPNVLSLTRVNHSVRSSDLTTRRRVARQLAVSPSVQVVAVAAAVIGGGRLWAGHFDRGDAIAPVATVLLIGFVEWLVHRSVLHAATTSWTDRWFGIASGHRRHHQQPTELRWLLLTGVEAAVAVLAVGAASAMWAAPAAWLIGASVYGTVLTAWACAVLALGHYECVHLLIHSGVTPHSRYYAHLARNHWQHHHVDERAWLGITSVAGDRVLGTAAAHRAAPAVPRPAGPRSTSSTLSLH